MSVYILFQKDNTISSWARAGYLKSTRQLSRWANGCGQDFSQLRDEQLATHLGNYHIHMGRCFLFRYCGNPILAVLAQRITDRKFLRLIARMLQAGVQTPGGIVQDELGSPQGSIVSPVIANVFLDTVLDQWFATVVT